MGTVTVDLPAHNVASPNVTVPDPECLANPSATTGVTISTPDDIVHVGSTDGTGGGDALGFGLFDLPAGATLVDVRFVGHVQRLGADLPVPPDSWDTSRIRPVPTDGPSLAVSYDGSPLTVGYALTPTDTLTEIVGDPIQHLLFGSDYVIAGIGTPDTGTFGLCPRIIIADSNWWEFPTTDHPILLTYLALRITYTTSGVYPLRRYPPVNNGGSGPTRHYPRAVNRRAGGTY